MTGAVLIGLALALALIVAISGAVVTIIDPRTLPFHDYAEDVVQLAAALGLTAAIGAGAGHLAARRNNGEDK